MFMNIFLKVKFINVMNIEKCFTIILQSFGNICSINIGSFLEITTINNEFMSTETCKENKIRFSLMAYFKI